jgi:hypothetical protein
MTDDEDRLDIAVARVERLAHAADVSLRVSDDRAVARFRGVEHRLVFRGEAREP